MSSPSVPQELLFPRVSRALNSKQTLTYVNANQTGTISSANGAQNILRIQLPQTDYLNPKQSYLQFKAKVVDDGGLTNSQFRNGIGCLFQAIRVYVGGQLVEDCTDYDIIQRMLIDVECDDAKLNSAWDQGCGTNAALQSWDDSDRYYIHRLRTGFFSQDKLIPLWAMKGLVEIEFVFNPTNKALVYSAGTGHYEVNDFRMICELHTLDGSYNASMVNALNSTGVQILFPSFESYNAQLVGTSNDTVINNRRKSVKSLLMCIRSSSNLVDQASDWEFSLANLTSFNLKIGSQIYPNYDLPVGAPAKMELEKALGKLQMIPESSQMTFSTYVSSPTKAYLGLDLEHFLTQELVSGVDFEVSDTILHTNHSGVPSNAQLTVFVIYDCILMLSSSGVLISK